MDSRGGRARDRKENEKAVTMTPGQFSSSPPIKVHLQIPLNYPF